MKLFGVLNDDVRHWYGQREGNDRQHTCESERLAEREFPAVDGGQHGTGCLLPLEPSITGQGLSVVELVGMLDEAWREPTRLGEAPCSYIPSWESRDPLGPKSRIAWSVACFFLLLGPPAPSRSWSNTP